MIIPLEFLLEVLPILLVDAAGCCFVHHPNNAFGSKFGFSPEPVIQPFFHKFFPNAPPRVSCGGRNRGCPVQSSPPSVQYWDLPLPYDPGNRSTRLVPFIVEYFRSAGQVFFAVHGLGVLSPSTAKSDSRSLLNILV